MFGSYPANEQRLSGTRGLTTLGSDSEVGDVCAARKSPWALPDVIPLEPTWETGRGGSAPAGSDFNLIWYSSGPSNLNFIMVDWSFTKVFAEVRFAKQHTGRLNALYYKPNDLARLNSYNFGAFYGGSAENIINDSMVSENILPDSVRSHLKDFESTTAWTSSDVPEIRWLQKMNDFEKVRRDLLSYDQVEPYWDGFSENPPPKGALQDALTILNALQEVSVMSVPRASATGDEVALYWRKPGMYCEFGFEGDGEYYFYGRINDEEPFKLDNLVVLDNLPDEIRNFLVSYID